MICSLISVIKTRMNLMPARDHVSTISKFYTSYIIFINLIEFKND